MRYLTGFLYGENVTKKDIKCALSEEPLGLSFFRRKVKDSYVLLFTSPYENHQLEIVSMGEYEKWKPIYEDEVFLGMALSEEDMEQLLLQLIRRTVSFHMPGELRAFAYAHCSEVLQ